MITIRYTHSSLCAEAQLEAERFTGAGLEAIVVADPEACEARPVDEDDVVYLDGDCSCGQCAECRALAAWDRAQAKYTEQLLGDLDEMIRGHRN